MALVTYQGTRYCGWQKQKAGTSNAASIQETIEQAVRKITREEKISIVGSGRTDAGVHALGQVLHFVLRDKDWDPEILFKALNSLLPVSIRVRSIKRIPIEFHAQKTATRKQYSYYFQQGPCTVPHLEPLSWWIRKQLDIPAMQRALDDLVGVHDFKPLQASGSKVGTTVREIFEGQVEWVPLGFPAHDLGPDWGLVRVRVLGSGFLKQMVRGIAGTLLEVGEGRRPATCFEEILRLQERSLVGPTAPAKGLWLERVWYPEAFDFG